MARHTLRHLIDGPVPLAGIEGASPAAQHVSKHVQDPFGATKDGIEELNDKKSQYEIAQQNMKRQLAPVKSVVQQIEDTHDLNEDEEQGYQEDPNNPGMMMPVNNKMGGVPQNMNQQPGSQVQNFPAANKTSPGTGPVLAPGRSAAPGQMVRPPKMGQAQPGAQNPAGTPSGQTNKTAPKKVSAKPKVGAGQGGSRSIKVHVAAGAAPGVRLPGTGLKQMMAGASLTSLAAGGPGSGRHKTTAVALRHGYEYNKEDSAQTPLAVRDVHAYRRPCGCELQLSPNGSWTHYRHDGLEKNGSGHASLEAHIKSIHR